MRQFSICHEKEGEELWDKIQYEPGGSLRHCLSSSSISQFLLSSSARCTDIGTGGSHILEIAIIGRQSCENCCIRTRCLSLIRFCGVRADPRQIKTVAICIGPWAYFLKYRDCAFTAYTLYCIIVNRLDRGPITL